MGKVNIEAAHSIEMVREVLADVHDPEIPCLSIADLGILRDIYCSGDRIIVVITPPAESSGDKRALMGSEPQIQCPQCASAATEIISEFGSTACKALYRCTNCLEPFDYFKCL